MTTTTIAFRLTTEQRRSIDALAQQAGIATSEYVRRATLGRLRTERTALEQAAEGGRNQIREQLAVAERERDEALMAAKAWQRRAYELGARLSDLPDELIEATNQVLAGRLDARLKVAHLWGAIDHRRRYRLCPMLAAHFLDEYDRFPRGLRLTEEEVDRRLEYVSRMLWLCRALDPETGSELVMPRRPERSPYIDVVNALDSEMTVIREAETLSIRTDPPRQDSGLT